MIWLIRLYPRRWRDRYGGELEQLVRDLGPSRFRPVLALDLVKGALDAHVRQGIAMNVVQRRAVTRVSVIVGVVWLGLTLEILFSNVVFPSGTDDEAIPGSSRICVCSRPSSSPVSAPPVLESARRAMSRRVCSPG